MPSHHSSSSHSSSSRSSSSRSSSSSSRSSSSRSSSSSSRSSYSSSRSGSGPSRHSSSSHSSSSRSGSGSFFRQTGRSQSSSSSRPAPQPARRPRINQPVGFLLSQTLRPTYYYGRRHDYVYYPESWTDSASGTRYEKGYYDENGKFYDSVAFQKNGRYENVVCHCPYCDYKTVMNLQNSAGSGQSMQCPNCGATMEIQSELDEIAGQGAENTHTYDSEASLEKAFGGTKKKRSPALFLVITAAVVLIIFQTARSVLRGQQHELTYAEPAMEVTQLDEPAAPQADTLHLEKQSDGSYHLVTDPLRADRLLVYDAAEDSYYDETSDCWLWYNTDVEPGVWQYWFEGISSDFGDYGWMEHDEDGWWIEESFGNWIQLPDSYDTDDLWYID